MNLLQQAQKDLMDQVIVRAIVKHDGRLLLVEQEVGGEFMVPEAVVSLDESLTQALQRSVVNFLGRGLVQIVEYLASRDQEKKRRLYFIVEIDEPRSTEMTANHPVSWLVPEEAVGYPISDELREIIDLLSR